MLTLFNRLAGTKQGRIDPSSVEPLAGSRVFCLGSDDAGRIDEVANGNFVLAEQTATLTANTTLLIVRARVRPPSACPDGCAWEWQVLLDGVVKGTHRLRPGMGVHTRELSINVSKLSGSVTLTSRLRFVELGEAEVIAMADFEVGP